MAKYKTNIFEMVLRETLIGETIYDKDGKSLIIKELNYDPTVRCAYVTDGVKKFKIKVDDYFDYEFAGTMSSDRTLSGNSQKFKNK
jgi:hypothetical protein